MAYSDEIDPKYTFGGIFSAVLGFGFVKFVGFAAQIPFSLIGIAFFVLHRMKYNPECLRPLLTLQFAQLGWFGVGALVFPSEAMNVGADIAVGLALILWLGFSRHWLPLALIFLMQIFGIFVNFQVYSGSTYSFDANNAMLVHILVRILILVAAIYFFYVKYMDGPDGGSEEQVFD